MLICHFSAVSICSYRSRCQPYMKHFNKKSKFISGFQTALCGMMRYHQYDIALKDCPASGVWAYPHYLKQ